MAVRDDEGLIFREIRKKVLNEGSEEPQKPHEKTDVVKSEVTNHIEVSVFSGFKFGFGMILGTFAGMIIVSIVVIVLLLLFSLIVAFPGIDIMALANETVLT